MLMADAAGVGLAGNQVGVLRRLVVMLDARRGRAGRARQPADRRAERRDRRRGRGLPLAAGRARPRRAKRRADGRGARRGRGGAAPRARGARRPRRAARARPPRRRADPRPDDGREPARGARRSCARSRSCACASPSPRRLRSARTSSSASPRAHEIAFLLTRPDAPRGRGRKLGAAARRRSPSGSASRCSSRSGSAPRHELDANVIVVAAYGLLIPQALLERALWLNVHPSLLPRWRGAAPVERAIMAGDEETGVTIHETVTALDAGPIAAQRAFPIGPEDDAGAIFARAAEVGAEPARRGAAGRRRSSRSPRTASPTPRRSRPRTASSTWSRPPQESLDRIRALSPHIGAWASCTAGRVTIWRAEVDDGELVAARGAARGRAADGLRRVPPRRRGDDLARAARRLRGRAARLRGRRVRRPRVPRRARAASTRATARSRSGSRTGRCSACARSTTGSTSSAAGPCASSTRPCARRSGSPATSSARRASRAYAVADDVGRARAAGGARARGRRSRTPSRGALRGRASRGARRGRSPEGPLRHSYPDWIWETWVRDWGAEEALALMRAQNEPRRRSCARPRPVGASRPDVPGAWRVERVDADALAAGRIWPQSRGSQLAALVVGARDGERVLDACAAPGGKATMLRGEVTAVEVHPGRARELEENVAPPRRDERARRQRGRARAPPERGFDRALVDAPCSGLGVLARGPDLRWRAQAAPRAAARAAPRRGRAHVPAARSSTRSAR